MPSQAYQTIRAAMEARQQIICTYNGYHRELCVHTLGVSGGSEMMLAYQFAGDSSKPPTSDSQRWRCLDIAKLEGVSARSGEWHTSANHSQNQTCVKEVDLEIFA